MKTSEKGINLIKKFEGCRLTAYKCDQSEKYYTIGYGHYGKDVTANMVINEEQATTYLKSDLTSAEHSVNKWLNKYNFNQSQYDALVSFTFNCGSGNLAKLLANGTRTIADIVKALPLYNKCNGKILNGLVKRRKAEVDLFLSEDNIKSYTDIAKEVIAGKWGNGTDRKQRLINAGYDYSAIQNLVNEMIITNKDNHTIALEVIAGKWGNGTDRKQRLINAGYDYNEVQKEVNRLL